MCEPLRADWLNLLPLTSDACYSPFGLDGLRLEGVVGGVRVERDYYGRDGGATMRLEELLGVPTS